MNYFELFNIPVSFQVNQSVLSKKYFELQKQFHPDFFTMETEADQKEALEKSSEVNKALKILKNPDLTMQYFLQIKGLLSDNEKYNLPPGFLMEMMELNEKLTDEDPATFREEVAQLEEDLFAPVKDIVEAGAGAPVTEENLLKVKEYYFKKKYLHRILDRLDD